MSDKKDESSDSSDLATSVGNTSDVALLQGFGKNKPTFRVTGKDSPVQKYRKKKPPSTPLKNRTFAEECFTEIVRKRGSVYVMFDDQTGVQLGTFNDRKTAWAKQRIRRQQDKYRRNLKKNSKKSRKQKTAIDSLKKLKNKKESFVFDVISKVLSEKMNPYVFEQSPTSVSGWQEFLKTLTHRTIQSDPRLKGFMDNVYKNEEKALQKAWSLIKAKTEKTKKFTVSKGVLTRDEMRENPTYRFTVMIPSLKKKIELLIKVENNMPVLSFSEITKAQLNSTQEDIKLLRVELMHVQETELKHVDDIKKAAEKRDKYLKGIEKTLDRVISSFVPVKIALLNNLLRTKYKGIET